MSIALTARRLLGTVSCSFVLAMSLLAPQPAAAQAVQGVTDNEIVVGVISDLSGPLASVGSYMRDGMALAAEEVNEAGGIYGRKIKVLTEDSGLDPKKAVLAAQKLVLQDKVFALVGTLGSANHVATQNIALERNVPVVGSIAATDVTFLPKHPLKFGLFGTAEDSMRLAVSYMYKQGRRNFAIFYQDDDTGRPMVRAAEEQLKVYGLSLVEKVSHKRGEINFSSQVAKLKAAKPDVVLLGILPREAGAFAIEAKAQDWKVDAIISSSVSHAVTEIGGAATEGMYGTCSFANQAQTITPAFTAIAQKYKTRFNREYKDGVNVGYNVLKVFLEGVKNAGKNLTPQTFSQGMEKIRDFHTVFDMAPVTYSSDYHGPPKANFVLQVKNGRWVKLSEPVHY